MIFLPYQSSGPLLGLQNIVVANLETVDGASNFKDIVASNDHHLGQIILGEMGWNHHLGQITWINGGNEHIDQIRRMRWK